MDRFAFCELIRNSKPITKESFIQTKCAGKIVLDLGCVRHSVDFALKDPNWLHRKIREVAKKVIGVDFLPLEVERLKSNGYDCVAGDVTKKLDINERFDVIVAGDIIEHLVNFEGFFSNCRDLLKPDGILIMTTANPFYSDEFHYVAWKRNFLVNPEHTCWIDPQCLHQLSTRLGFVIKEIHFLKNPWQLKGIIAETKDHVYDIFEGNWSNDSFKCKSLRFFLRVVFNLFYLPFKLITFSDSALVKYGDYLAVLRVKDKLQTE